MMGTLLLILMSQLPPEVTKLQEEVKQIKVDLLNKEKELDKLIISIPEKLGPVETLEIQGYGMSNAQKILSGPNLNDIGKYKVISIIQPPGDQYNFIGWLNNVRASYGLQPVGHDPTLSNDAAINNQYGFGHHYMGNMRRQNAAWGMSDIASVGAAWMNSAGHRSALLDPTITMMGIAYNGAVWTWGAR